MTDDDASLTETQPLLKQLKKTSMPCETRARARSVNVASKVGVRVSWGVARYATSNAGLPLLVQSRSLPTLSRKMTGATLAVDGQQQVSSL